MATHADEGNSLPQLTLRELQTRKAFVGLDVAATRALQALRPWMEAHVHEVVEEFLCPSLALSTTPLAAG